ncbi:MAG TPA: WYL domain-containing protein [Phycicoccus sp.]|nr:WYL domain-containing protein [Phycicoccus sp.]
MAGATPPPAAESALSRLSRLLTMVPWLVNRQGIDLEEAAADLGISVEQLTSDLELLFLCGYGQMPDELIDAQWDEGQVFIDNAEAIARPLRLGMDEAVALIVGLRALREIPGLGERDAVERALAKLEAAAGSAAEAADRVGVSLSASVDEAHLASARRAVEQRRRVRLRYLVPGRDESTDRLVDPIRVLNMDDRWYLEGWCHRAAGMRTFRMDRIEDLEVTDADGTPPAEARARDLDQGLFQAGVDDQTVTVRLGRGARWVADYYPVESSEAIEDGGRRITLRTGDTEWLVRLALRLGGECVIESPESLRSQVSDSARSALTAYDV